MREPLNATPEWLERQKDREAALNLEIFSQVIQLRHKYNYFVMSLATAAVAFAVQQSANTMWTDKMWWWLFSILFWALSISFGLMLEKNHSFLLQCSSSISDKDKEDALNKLEGGKYLNVWLFYGQHISLFFGLLVFMVWNICKMIKI